MKKHPWRLWVRCKESLAEKLMNMYVNEGFRSSKGKKVKCYSNFRSRKRGA